MRCLGLTKCRPNISIFQFTADEDTNDTGVTAVDIGFSAGDEPFWPAGTDVETKSSDVGGFGGYDEVSMDFEALKQMVPRAVKLQIGATQFNINSELITDDGNSLSYDETELNEELIRSQLGNMVDESFFTATGYNAGGYANFYLQDNNFLNGLTSALGF